jgi:hypothetical protein
MSFVVPFCLIFGEKRKANLAFYGNKYYVLVQMFFSLNPLMNCFCEHFFYGINRAIVRRAQNKKSRKNKKCVHSYGLPSSEKISKKIEEGVCREKNSKK